MLEQLILFTYGYGRKSRISLLFTLSFWLFYIPPFLFTSVLYFTKDV
jgi:hypothetical protein